MRSYRSRVFPAAAAVVLTACADETATGVALAAADTPSDLALVVPTGVREQLVERTLSEITPPSGPARTEDQGYGTYYYGDEPLTTTAAGIWNEKTRANFVPGALSVIGSHDYTGNKGSIDTRATLARGGETLATRSAYKEQSVPFLSFPWVQSIWVEARIYTDSECGLNGWGDSAHRAWWEAIIAGPVFDFAEVGRPSTSDREFQPECPATPPPSTGTGSTSGGGAEVTCYIWIVYDLDTGEIYHQQLLFCTDGG
jgi:hypothetical protein